MNNKKKLIKETVKKHIPQRHLSSIRIMYRIAMETVYGIKRTGLLNIAIVAAMAAILTIFGSLFRTSFSLSSFVDKLGDTFEISVYLKPNVDPVYMSSRIRELEHVKRITIITKEQAWEEMNKDIDVSGMENPLPDTLHVTVDDPSNIAIVCDEIKKVSGIEEMSYAQDIAKKLQTFTNVFNTVTVFVLIAVAILTIIIINCTIQLVIQSRKEEIEIMRLMGVSNWYIKIPLILQGAIYGFSGAIISLIPLNTIQNALFKLHNFLVIPPSEFAMNIVVFSLFVIAVFFSAGGSLLSIKKHLQV
ncbi:MAG: permease-like cell division protein FtsX [Candidatus Gastranaerophilales bacterium]|nr:permease-like cell division protein FtsX [Candidatus Gastranaerophilales bacterium]